MAFRTENRHSMRFKARKQIRHVRERMAVELQRMIDYIDPHTGKTA